MEFLGIFDKILELMPQGCAFCRNFAKLCDMPGFFTVQNKYKNFKTRKLAFFASYKVDVDALYSSFSRNA